MGIIQEMIALLSLLYALGKISGWQLADSTEIAKQTQPKLRNNGVVIGEIY